MPPVVIAAGIGAVGVIGSSIIKGKAAKKASQAQQQGLADANQIQMDAIAQANIAMANAQVEAAGLIADAQYAAAEATIKAAKISAQAILEATQLSVAAQERFFAIADQKLEPFRQQGLAAGVEMASMLGIPNAEGEIVPYDIEKLRAIPEFKFVFDVGQRAVERSYAGQKLSGAQIKAQMEFGQGLGERVFQGQFNNLSSIYNTGAGAAGQLANAAVQSGRGIGGAYSNQGNQLANVYSNQGNQLSNIYTNGGNQLASIATNFAQYQAGLINDMAINRANLGMAAAQNRASLYANRGKRNAGLLSDLFKLGGAAYGAYRDEKE